MLSFISFITEAAEGKKAHGIQHLEHPADRSFDSQDAAEHALKTIKGVASGKTPITRKIDDKMSYHAMRDANGKVGVKYKGSGSHYNFSAEDINKQHGHKPYLAHPLHALLSHLGKVLPKTPGEYQGGHMSTPDTRTTEGGKIHHTPNTIKYSAHVSSPEGKALKRSKVSTVIHSKIDKEGHASPITDTSDFGSHPDVHRVEHVVAKHERTLAPEHKADVTHHVKEAEKLMQGHTYGHLAGHDGHLRTYINSTVRSDAPVTVAGYKAHLAAKHDKLIAAVTTDKSKQAKTEKKNLDVAHITKNKPAFQRTFDIHHHLQSATNALAKGLDAASHQHTETSIGGEKTGGEGYVGNGVKIVDRQGFAKANLAASARFKK